LFMSSDIGSRHNSDCFRLQGFPGRFEIAGVLSLLWSAGT